MMHVRPCLLLVDVQNDFCPGGALAVVDGDKIVPILNRYMAIFASKEYPIVASRDWHPARTKHFKDFGGSWPVHCVQNTSGAAFHPLLRLPAHTVVVSKGMDPGHDSYSAFQAFNTQGRSLLEVLRGEGIQELFVGGLATDYCVKASVLDALKYFKVNILIDAIKGVNIRPDDSQRALEEMMNAGALEISLNKLKDFLK